MGKAGDLGRQRPGTPTLEEVAALAGVGRGTVSRVINNATGVRDSTRRAVQQAIAELGYVPNLAARSLAGHRADAVALVMTEPDWRLFGEPFFSEIVQAVGDALTDTPLQLLLTLVRTDTERQRFVEYARGGRVDGVLPCPCTPRTRCRTRTAAAAPRTHRTPVTVTAACRPLTNAWPLPSMTAALICADMSPETGAMPIVTASSACSRPCARPVGTPAPVSSPNSEEPTLPAITVISTEVPRAPPICSMVDCRPEATPPSLTGALPMIVAAVAGSTMPTPRPIAMNGGHIVA
ncbi:HTH-type transcriptional repressor PurR [Streptomyces tendae]